MPQAPYTPFPTAQPYVRPSPELSLNPGAAFGENIGRSLESLGGAVEKDGNELFTRAMALQELRNEADARMAQQDFALKAGKLYADYGAEQGVNAVNKLQPFQDNLTNLRMQIRGTLTNQMATKMFDSDSMPYMQRVINEGAGHAAKENKNYLKASNNALIGGIKDDISSHSDNDILFEDGLKKIAKAQQQNSDIEGYDQSTNDFLVRQEQSDAAARRVQSVSLRDPKRGAQLLQDYINRGLITGKDIDPTTLKVRQETYTIGARNIVRQLYTGQDSSLGEVIINPARARDAIGTGAEGNNYSAHPPVPKGVHAGEEALGRYQILESNLGPWLKEAGMPAMTKEQFLADHDAQDKLFDFKFGQYQQQEHSFNGAAARWFSGMDLKTALEKGVDDGHWNMQQYLAHTNARLFQTASDEERMNAAGARGQEYGGDIAPDMDKYVRADMFSQLSQDRVMRRDADWQVKNDVQSMIASGKYSTYQDFEKDPQGIQLIEQANPNLRIALPGMIQRYAAQRDAETEKENLYKIYKMYLDPEQRDAFMELDPTQEKLSQSSIRFIWGLQREVAKTGHADPKISQIYGNIERFFPSGVPAKTTDPAGYQDFQARLMDAIVVWRSMHDKDPDLTQQREIGKMLLTEQAHNGMWGTYNTKAFQEAVPDEFSVEYLKEHPNANSDEVSSAYFQSQWDLYLRNNKPANLGPNPPSATTTVTPPAPNTANMPL